jgi:hypothetical protein
MCRPVQRSTHTTDASAVPRASGLAHAVRRTYFVFLAVDQVQYELTISEFSNKLSSTGCYIAAPTLSG